MQGIGWCDMGMGFLCVSGCSAVWVEIGTECVARESGVGWRIFANFGGIVATPLAFRAEMLASRGSLCVALHHRNATTPSGPASPSKAIKSQQSHQVQHPLKSAHQIPAMNNHPPLLSPLRDHQPHASSKNLNKTPFSFPTYCNSSINSSLCTQPAASQHKK